MNLENKAKSESKKLLLMGSSAFNAEELPVEVKERIDKAIASEMTIIVGAAHGASGFYQD